MELLYDTHGIIHKVYGAYGQDTCFKRFSEFHKTEKAMNSNWSNEKANPALKTKMGNN